MLCTESDSITVAAVDGTRRPLLYPAQHQEALLQGDNAMPTVKTLDLDIQASEECHEHEHCHEDGCHTHVHCHSSDGSHGRDHHHEEAKSPEVNGEVQALSGPEKEESG
jgi:hypothetical protein